MFHPHPHHLLRPLFHRNKVSNTKNLIPRQHGYNVNTSLRHKNVQFWINGMVTLKKKKENEKEKMGFWLLGKCRWRFATLSLAFVLGLKDLCFSHQNLCLSSSLCLVFLFLQVYPGINFLLPFYPLIIVIVGKMIENYWVNFKISYRGL